MAKKLDEKIIFALAHTETGPILTLGISTAAWEYMKDGMAHTFDLSSAGFPVKLMLFGAPSHEAALQTIKDAAAQNDVPMLDRRHKDWSIQ